jgi:hypothetical protein
VRSILLFGSALTHFNFGCISRYYADDIDNFTGARKVPREVLTLALQGTKAAATEIGALVNLLPYEITDETKQRIGEEFQ